MDSYKAKLIPLLTKANALAFGTYTLKSGRQSPYFFNSSLLENPTLVRPLLEALAAVLTAPPFSLPAGTEEEGSAADGQFKPHFDVIFGPAYKGIALAAFAISGLAVYAGPAFDHIGYSYNRKEAKNHGDGGTIVGRLQGRRVIVIDDVLTAGTALREAVSIIKAQGGTVVGVVLLLNRQERVSDEEPRSAIKVAEDDLKVPVQAVLNFEDLVEAIEAGQVDGVGPEQVEQMKSYREKYGSTD